MIERFLNSDLFAFLIFAAMIYITVRLIRHYRYHGSDVKYFRIYSGVHDLEQIVTQLEQLEEIQTSIELAKFHRLNLIERYKEHTDRRQISTTNEFITKYADFIFSTPQLVDLYRRLNYKNPKAAASKYKSTHKIDFYSLRELRDYVQQIRKAAERFTNS